MNITRLLPVLCAVFMIVGCSDDSVMPNDSTVDPYVTGNYWIYRDTYFNSDGSVESIEEDSLAVFLSRTTNGETTIEFSNGFVFRRTALGILNNDGLLYKYPSVVDDTFFTRYALPLTTDTSFLGDMMRFNEGVNVSVTVPAGTFQCYKYTTNTTKASNDTVIFKIIDHFDANTGLIKSEMFTSTKLQQPLIKLSMRELIRYKIE